MTGKVPGLGLKWLVGVGGFKERILASLDRVLHLLAVCASCQVSHLAGSLH